MDKQQYMAEDEIDLRKHINVLIKRKNLILAIFLVAIVVSAATSLSMPKVYEITSTVQLGNIGGLLIGKGDAKEMILNQNSLLSIIKELNLQINVEGLKKSIKIDDLKETNLLTVKIVYPDSDIILKIHDAILNPLITQGQDIYQGRLALTDERLKELDAEIKNTEADIDGTQNMIFRHPDSSSVSQADVALGVILLQNTLPSYESNLTVLRNQRNRLKFTLVEAKGFKIFDAPIKPENPIGPKKRQIVINFGIIGLTLGAFLAFFMEFWQNSGKGR